MAITRSTLYLRSRQMADAVDATADWPDTLLAAMASFVYIDEWKKLLGAASHYQTNRVTLTPDSDGRVAWDDLTTGTGDDQKIAHRVLQLRASNLGDYTYAQASRLDLLADLSQFSTQRLWTRVGTEIQIIGAHNTTISGLVNWYPPSPDNLASDSSTVQWPNGYEMLLYMETAALMLAKAGRETNEARDLQQQAEIVRQKMHQEFARDTNAPYVIGADDSVWEWGG